MTMASRLEREGAIIELGKKTYRESCRAYCFSVLNVNDEDLMRVSLAAEAGVEW